MDWLTGLLPGALIGLICPLLMLLMMRGMHGGHDGAGKHHTAPATDTTQDELARLRDEVAALREQAAGRR